MIVESLKINNYRNYKQEEIELGPGINIFYGDNGQGKTNLLESVYLCATSRSHRGSKDKELIRFGQEEAHIRMMFLKNDLSHRMDVHLIRNKSKGIALDGISFKKAGELLGTVPVVFFSPEDLSIIKYGPSGRRKFLDMEMSLLHNRYLKELITYNKVLYERNNLLKQIRKFPQLTDTLDGWNDQLLFYGKKLIIQREEFVDHLGKMMKEIHGQLTGKKEDIRVVYEKNVSEDEFEEKLASRLEKDIHNGSTSVGPHRDDLAFLSNDIDLRKYGSQGQQRTAALSLKLSEIRLVEELSGEKPVFLLDDVLSELDKNRQNWLLESVKDIQVMITCTGLEDLIQKRIQLDKVFYVKEGSIQEMSPPTLSND